MAGMPWVKVYTEMLDDVKLSRLTDAQKWRFIQLILLAGECDAGGALVTGESRVTHAEVCWRLRCDSQILSDDLAKLQELGLVLIEDDIITVTKFGERQGPTQAEKRESWQKRQEKHRNKVKCKDVTRDSRVSHALEEEEERRVKQPSAAPEIPPSDWEKIHGDGREVKNQRALDAIRAGEKAGREAPSVDAFPADVQNLAAVFIRQSGLQPTKKTDVGFWVNGLRELVNCGIGADYMTRAIKQMRDDQLTIKSPSSIKAVALDIKAQAEKPHTGALRLQP